MCYFSFLYTTSCGGMLRIALARLPKLLFKRMIKTFFAEDESN